MADDYLPERRANPAGFSVSEFRLSEVEKSLSNQDTKLEKLGVRMEARWDQIDGKLDQLRQDLFEKHPFVPTTVFNTAMSALSERVASLERSREGSSGNLLIIIGIALAFIAAVGAPFVADAIK